MLSVKFPRPAGDSAPRLKSFRPVRWMAALGLFATVAAAQAATTYTVTELSLLNNREGSGSFGTAVNERGQVTGGVPANDIYVHAFLFDGTMHDLGTFGGARSSGSAINSRGFITGAADISQQPFSFHAFLYDGTAKRDLGTLGGDYSVGLAINNRGQVAGYATTPNNAETHAILYDGTAMKDLGTLGTGTVSYGLDINAKGMVAGYSYLTPAEFSAYHAFLYDGTSMRDLGTLGGEISDATAINSRGQVTGASYTANNEQHPFLYDGHVMKDLGTLGGQYGSGLAINERGQVTGYAYISSTLHHAFLYDGKATRDLGTLGGRESYSRAINSKGQVIGYADTAGDVARHAFVWSDSEGMVDLNTAIVNSPPGLELTDATALSDNGYIVANSNIGLVLLTPHHVDSDR